MSTPDIGDRAAREQPHYSISSSSSSGSTDHHLVSTTVTPCRAHRAYSPSQSPDSPGASVALSRTAETLEGLSLQLAQLADDRLAESDPDLAARCCCGATADCPTLASRDRINAKLHLCGEIGSALLQRYEALEQKFQRSEHQVEIKRKALADSLRHVANLERANTTHLKKYADLSQTYGSLEKRYVQTQHSHTLTQQSLTVVRAEYAKYKATTDATAAVAASGASLEDRLLDAERRFEDARDLHQAETRKLREQLKWRKLAEERIADLESKLTAAGREVEDTKAARARDAQELLVNAKGRLETLHQELSEAFQGSSPADVPEYQRTLEDLVASNALLKHDTSELARSLSQTMEENRQLRDELDELKQQQQQRPSPVRSRPLSVELSHLRPLLTRGHSRTGSNPVVSDLARPPMHARVASAAVPRPSAWESERQHRRQNSIAPSFTSTSTTEGPSVTSPSPQCHDQGSPIIRTESRPLSPTMRVSSAGSKRSSFSTGIPYTFNGVPTSKRPLQARKGTSERRERRSITMHSLVGAAISEWPQPESERQDETNENSAEQSADQSYTDEPSSPGAGSYAPSEGSRKRASVLLPNVTTSPRTPMDMLSPMGDSGFDFALPNPAVPLEAGQRLEQTRVARRTLLLLSKSTGVQTDPVQEEPEPSESGRRRDQGSDAPHSSASSVAHSRQDSRLTTGSSRETASLAELVDYLTKILTRLRGIDVPTLNRRLKKQNLPGDVGHVSRSTITALQGEVENMRHKFRDLLELGSVSRREVTLLLKLLKDVFTDMLELQGVVNDVTINPKLAKKMQREAFQDEKVDSSAGLGWIAAPITSWLSAPAAKPAEAAPAPASPRKPEAARPSRLAQPSRTAPKLQASTSATTTHVSIEFGGSGQVRRAAPATPRKSTLAPPSADVFDAAPALPVSPGGQKRSQSLSVATGPGASAMLHSPAPAPSARPRQRSDLLGIFAGAQPQPGVSPNTRRVRHASSQYFGGRAVRSVTDPAAGRERLSTIVDAVLDPTKEAEEDFDALLQRQLRPRGLSDSSIRSARPEIEPDVRAVAAPAPAVRASVGGGGGGGGGIGSVAYSIGSGLGSLSRRIYGIRGEEPAAGGQSTAPKLRGSNLRPEVEDGSYSGSNAGHAGRASNPTARTGPTTTDSAEHQPGSRPGTTTGSTTTDGAEQPGSKPAAETAPTTTDSTEQPGSKASSLAPSHHQPGSKASSLAPSDGPCGPGSGPGSRSRSRSRGRSPSPLPMGRSPRSVSLAIPSAPTTATMAVSCTSTGVSLGSSVGRLRVEQERSVSDGSARAGGAGGSRVVSGGTDGAEGGDAEGSMTKGGSVRGRRRDGGREREREREEQIETLVASQLRGVMVGGFAPGSLPLRGGWT